MMVPEEVLILFQGEGPHLEFVEVVTPEGVGVSVGKWEKFEGFNALRVTIIEPETNEGNN